MTTFSTDITGAPTVTVAVPPVGTGVVPSGADAMVWTTLVQHALHVMNRKWTVSIVRVLEPGPMRFGVLRYQLRGIQSKVLRETLRALRVDGLVCQVLLDNETSAGIGWDLTPHGRSLVEPLAAVYEWSCSHLARECDADGNLEVPA